MKQVLRQHLAIGYALLTVAIGGVLVMVLAGMLLVAAVEVVTGGYPSSPLAGLPIVFVGLYAALKTDEMARLARRFDVLV